MRTFVAGAPALLMASSLAAAASAGPPPAGAVEPQPLSPQAQAAIAPIQKAYAEIDRAQAGLPPAKTDREKLERLIALSDAEAKVTGILPNLEGLPSHQARLALWAIGREREAHDKALDAALKEMTPADGWFTRSRYGEKALWGAFWIMITGPQDLSWWKDVLVRMDFRTGEVPPEMYAELYDLIAKREGRPQRFGTLLNCAEKGDAPLDVEDPERLDARRKQIGLPPESDYVRANPACGDG